MSNAFPSLRVLIVDDEALIRWSLAETLTDEGHEVAEVGDGAAAIDVLTNGGRFDVLLLDYHLPDSHDLNLLARIRLLVPTTVVVMMTAFATPEMSEGARRLGVYRIVAKPFEVHEIAALVCQAHASRAR